MVLLCGRGYNPFMRLFSIIPKAICHMPTLERSGRVLLKSHMSHVCKSLLITTSKLFLAFHSVSKIILGHIDIVTVSGRYNMVLEPYVIYVEKITYSTK